MKNEKYPICNQDYNECLFRKNKKHLGDEGLITPYCLNPEGCVFEPKGVSIGDSHVQEERDLTTANFGF